MRTSPKWIADVDEMGRLILPEAARVALRLDAGERASIELQDGRLMIGRPSTQLAKLYIEPTSRCNLACRMCLRNSWNQVLGDMGEGTFRSIVDGLRAFDPPPDVVFSGFGEPLSHPRIADMVAAVKQLGARASIVTNGTLLSKTMAGSLIEAGLDRLWVSLDGARPESHADVRPGASLPDVMINLSEFRRLRRLSPAGAPEIGIVFVAMRRNIAELPSLVRIGSQAGASRFIVTNVLPYAPELCDESLCAWAMNDWPSRPTHWTPEVRLPNIDFNRETGEALTSLLRPGLYVRFRDPGQPDAHDRCPFIENGAAAIGWDGSLSPCLALVCDQVTYMDERRMRSSKRYVVGNVAETSLSALWADETHQGFRARVREFEFSPCTACGGCDLSEANEEDCFGNTFPTCGGCLWAQGVLQCP